MYKILLLKLENSPLNQVESTILFTCTIRYFSCILNEEKISYLMIILWAVIIYNSLVVTGA